MAAWLAFAHKRPLEEEGTDHSARWWPSRCRWILHTGDAFIVVAIVGLLYVDLPTDVAEVARSVRDHKLTCKVPAVRAPIGGVHLDLIGVRALPATLNVRYTPSLGGKTNAFTDALYLGQSNGFIIAYRPDSRVLWRLPADTTTVAIKTGLPDCHGVH